MRTFINELYGQDYIKSIGDVYTAELELPGFCKDDVSITVDGEVLKVQAKKEGRDTKNFSVCLKELVSIEDITSKMSDGLLVVTMPKKEVKKSIKIKID